MPVLKILPDRVGLFFCLDSSKNKSKQTNKRRKADERTRRAVSSGSKQRRLTSLRAATLRTLISGA